MFTSSQDGSAVFRTLLRIVHPVIVPVQDSISTRPSLGCWNPFTARPCTRCRDDFWSAALPKDALFAPWVFSRVPVSCLTCSREHFRVDTAKSGQRIERRQDLPKEAFFLPTIEDVKVAWLRRAAVGDVHCTVVPLAYSRYTSAKFPFHDPCSVLPCVHLPPNPQVLSKSTHFLQHATPHFVSSLIFPEPRLHLKLFSFFFFFFETLCSKT